MMQQIVCFWVRGIPKAQPRPRAFARKIGGTFVARVYEAGTAEAWKSDVIVAARPLRPSSPIQGPVRVSLVVLHPRPKRLMRAKDPDGPLFCTSKPDRDNLDKAVLDALKTDGWFLDDAQVVDGRIRKGYHSKTGAPGAWITILPIDDLAFHVEDP